MRLFILVPLLIKIQNMIPFNKSFEDHFRELFINKYNHFSYPDGCKPNISDPSTYESYTYNNETEYNLQIENMIIYSLEPIINETIIFDNENKTEWEKMLKFSIGEF